MPTTHRKTVAVSDDEGRLTWFAVADAQQWASTAGTLFYIGTTWALRDHASAMVGDPAKMIDAQAALQWLVSRGHDIPAELQPLSETSRLR